jgi:prophage regulatory protein
MDESRNSELLRLPAVCAQTGLKRTQLYELIKRGEFPASIRISLRSVAWVRAHVDQWVHDRIALAQAARVRKGGA